MPSRPVERLGSAGRGYRHGHGPRRVVPLWDAARAVSVGEDR
jgi:hypothetical protein